MFPSKRVIEKLRVIYPVGTEVELVEMNDPQAPPVGEHGVVKGVDDAGTIMVSWNCGSSLGVLYDEDVIRKVIK